VSRFDEGYSLVLGKVDFSNITDPYWCLTVGDEPRNTQGSPAFCDSAAPPMARTECHVVTSGPVLLS
jgi:hypothetical protein